MSSKSCKNCEYRNKGKYDQPCCYCSQNEESEHNFYWSPSKTYEFINDVFDNTDDYTIEELKTIISTCKYHISIKEQ